MLLQSCFRRYPSTGGRKDDTSSSEEEEEPPSTSARATAAQPQNRTYPLRSPLPGSTKSAPARSPLSPSFQASSVPGRAVQQTTAGQQRPPLLAGLSRVGNRVGRGVAPSSSSFNSTAPLPSRPGPAGRSSGVDMGALNTRPISSSSTSGRLGLSRHASGASSSNDSMASSSSSHSRSLLPSIPANRVLSDATPASGRAFTTGTDLTRGGRRDKNGLCEKCDKDHDTDDCPYFKKPRDNHPDASRRKPMEMGGSGGNFKLASARMVRQPGDGSCLFHSIAYGLGNTNASRLRRELAEWVEAHPETLIAETPLRDWVKWDTGSSVRDYARRMAVGGWGGGIEMAACARLKRVNVHVYEHIPGQTGFKRISCFDVPGGGNNAPTVHVLYQGGVHFDALVPGSSWPNRL